MADLFVNYKCTNCQDDITGIRVHCAECINFDLCLQCFAAGAEIGEHHNNHAYQFMDTGTAILSIFRGKGAWSAREELRLLDAIEKYGFGNWEDISKHIETRSAEDAREEYISKYLNGTIGRHTWTPISESLRPQLEDHTIEEDSGPLGANIVQKLPPLDITPEEAAQLGYMPNRDGFEREYDPTAEQLVSLLTLNPDDVDVDLILKLAQIDIYTRRLRERARRKRLVRDFQLVANFFRGSNKSLKYNRDQREFRDRFRVFAQFYTAYEYERLLASLERERDLRVRLSELSRYRWNGLTRIDECIHFEQHAAALQHRNTGPYGHGKTDNLVTGNQRGSSSHLPHNKKTEINGNERNSNSIDQKFTHHTGDQIYSEGLSPNKNYLDSYRGLSGQSNQTMMTSTTQQQQQQATSNSNYQAPVMSQQQQQKQNENIIVNVIQKSIQPIDREIKTLQPSQMNQNQVTTTIDHLQTIFPQSQHIFQQQQNDQQQQPGENMLSYNEMQLCNALNLQPTLYITIKTILLSGLPVSTNYSAVENTIRKYFIRAGWLSQ